MSDPGDEHVENEGEFEYVDADEFAARIANRNIGLALEVFEGFMKCTDGVTAREAIAEARKMYTNPYEGPRSPPETQAMYHFKVGLSTILEMGAENALRPPMD